MKILFLLPLWLCLTMPFTAFGDVQRGLWDLYSGTRIVVDDIADEGACIDTARSMAAGVYGCRTITRISVLAETPPDPVLNPAVINNILFLETFEMADQVIKGRCRFEDDAECVPAPAGWDFIYTSDSNPAKPPCEIVNGVFRVYDESAGDRNSWGHDCQLAKHFAPQQFPELWIKLDIRFNPDLVQSGLNAAKIFRMGHYNPQVINGSTRTAIVNTNKVTAVGPTTSGLVFYDIKKVATDHYRHKLSMRGDPKYKMATKFNGPQYEFLDANGNVLVNKSWSATYGDGQWHAFELRIVMNTPGVSNGVVAIYFDGNYQGGRSDVPWIQAGHKPDVTGFNMFTLGGNADYIWDGQSNAEQWFYDIDNVQVCTTRCGSH